MIHFQDVSKKFGDNSTVLEKVNFSIEKGNFVFLIGPTGSGKTTIFRLIIRDLFPSEGNIVLGEWDLTKLPKGKVTDLRRKIGVVFQDLKLLLDRTVLENVMLPLQFAKVADKEAKDRAMEILMEVGLENKHDKFPLQLSGGERQRAAIARALVFRPDIILADEPTGNLDMQTSLQILDLFESINKKGVTVFMATHNESILEKLNRRVIVLEKGKIAEDRKPKEQKGEKSSSAKATEDKEEK